MARLEDLSNPDHRRLAEKRIPADLLARLHPAELLYRVKHSRKVMDTADTLPAESCRIHHAHVRKMLRSEPAADHILEQQRLRELEAASPSHDSRRAWRDALIEREEAHAYPPGLLEAVEMCFLGRPVLGDPETSAVA